MESIVLPVRRVDPRKGLDALVLDCLSADLHFALRAIAAQEIQKEVGQGNKPSNILVDNRAAPIDTATKRVQAFFANKGMVKAAAEEALRQMAALTRYKSGAARASFEIFRNTQRVSSIDEAIARFEPSDRIVIAGPTVPYGRKLNWLPEGKQRFSKKTIAKIGGTTYKTVSKVGVATLAARALKRQFKPLFIREMWIDTPTLGRTPGVAVGMKLKGSLQ